MATTYSEIIGFLNEEGIGYTDLRKKGEDGIAIGSTSSRDDDKPEYVIIKIDEDGEFVHFYEPQRYVYEGGEHKEEVLQTLLEIQGESKMLQWEYNPDNGDVRACV
ncbi:MAG: hypothetical protein R8K22_08570, partial [Mariprofundaceae bacterium]